MRKKSHKKAVCWQQLWHNLKEVLLVVLRGLALLTRIFFDGLLKLLELGIAHLARWVSHIQRARFGLEPAKNGRPVSNERAFALKKFDLDSLNPLARVRSSQENSSARAFSALQALDVRRSKAIERQGPLILIRVSIQHLGT